MPCRLSTCLTMMIEAMGCSLPRHCAVVSSVSEARNHRSGMVHIECR